MDPLERKEKALAEKWEKEGFQWAGLFGCDFQETLRALKKALKPHGLVLERRGSYSAFGDASFIRIVKETKCPQQRKASRKKS